jgi:hypothetical protein
MLAITTVLVLVSLVAADTTNIYVDGKNTTVTIISKNSNMSQDYIV